MRLCVGCNSIFDYYVTTFIRFTFYPRLKEFMWALLRVSSVFLELVK